MKDDKVYLAHIADAIGQIVSHTAGGQGVVIRGLRPFSVSSAAPW